MSAAEKKKLIGAIDQGTSSSRFLVFDASRRVVCQAQHEFTSIYPQQGWVEQDPWTLVNTVKRCIAECAAQLKPEDGEISAIGITNQRETTVVWDANTGEPLHNAIVWLDARTKVTVEKMLIKAKGDKNVLRAACGLPISTYFSALKLRWLLDNVEAVKQAADEERLCFGTVDSWLLWNLCKVHVTDVTNASRTMLMNLENLDWDQDLSDFFEIPKGVIFPKILSCSEHYGDLIYEGSPWPQVLVCGCLGDQQAALVGQGCLSTGMAKNTYGTGCFMLYNVGDFIVHSESGMLSTVAYKMGKDKSAIYALEGSIAIAGAAVVWLRDNMGLISEAKDIEAEAIKVEDTGGVCFVPAFGGLFAPHWRTDARGVICGLTQFTRREHICRATLEAVALQTVEVVNAMDKDSGLKLKRLLVDGGMTKNALLMQMQSDFLGIDVVRPSNVETTALGAAMAAGYAIGLWNFESDIDSNSRDGDIEFKPKMDAKERSKKINVWKKAVERSLKWETN